MQPKRESSRLSDLIIKTMSHPRPLKELRSLGSRSSSRGRTTASLLLGHKATSNSIESAGKTSSTAGSATKSLPGSRSTSKSRRHSSGFDLDNKNLQWQRRQQNTPSQEVAAESDDHDDHEDESKDSAHHGRRKSMQMIRPPSTPASVRTSEDDDESSEDDSRDEDEKEEEGGGEKRRHIHPCICDIDKRRWVAIRAHLKKKQLAQAKFEARLRQIEEEYRLAEEAELERRRQLEEEQELYGDEYETAGVHPKRKKRSARRASMVSLGVKQIINWRKSPKIKVRLNKTSALRKDHPTYCGRWSIASPSRADVKWQVQPKISVRTTKAVTLRNLEIKKRIAVFEKERGVAKYPNRPPFTLITCVF